MTEIHNEPPNGKYETRHQKALNMGLKRTVIELPISVFADIDDAASSMRLSRSGLVRLALLHFVRNKAAILPKLVVEDGMLPTTRRVAGERVRVRAEKSVWSGGAASLGKRAKPATPAEPEAADVQQVDLFA